MRRYAEFLDGQRGARKMSEIRKDILRFAKEGVGGAYVWGGTAYKAWDCSGYVQWTYRQAGVNLPRVDQWRVGTRTDNPQPGDPGGPERTGTSRLGTRWYSCGGRHDVQRVESCGGYATASNSLEYGYGIFWSFEVKSRCADPEASMSPQRAGQALTGKGSAFGWSATSSFRLWPRATGQHRGR